jgi:transcription initiation factor TFIIIB Brf1 subunit/transcription initiation factor TFIIB
MKCKNKSCRSRNIVLDQTNGIQVCSDCGFVRSQFVIDQGPEWRRFQSDRCRVGQPMNVGLPQELQMGTFTSIHHCLREDVNRWNMYNENRSILRRACDLFKLDSTGVDACFEVFGLYRECRSVIRNLSNVHAAVLYHVSFLVYRPIPMNGLCLHFSVERRSVNACLKVIDELTSGYQPNENDVVFSVNPVTIDRRRIYHHLTARNLRKQAMCFAVNLAHQFKVQEECCEILNAIGDLYFETFSDTQRDPETIGAGIFYHTSRHLSRLKSLYKSVKLSDISKSMRISDSSINDFLHDLPPLPNTCKRKRYNENYSLL